jgi:hypothetical protein
MMSSTFIFNDGFFAQSGEPLKPFFFQFLFLAVQIRHPLGKRFVTGLSLEAAAKGMDEFLHFVRLRDASTRQVRGQFLPTRHDGILPREAGLGRKKSGKANR